MLLIVNLSMSRWSLTSEFIDDAEDGELSSTLSYLLLVLLTLYRWSAVTTSHVPDKVDSKRNRRNNRN